MKKIISIALSLVLLLTTVIVAIPASASDDVNAVYATPIIDWTRSSASYATTTTTEVMPLGWTSAKGIKMVPSSTYETTPYEATSIGGSTAFAWANMNAAIQGGNATHYMLYVKLDSANTILPSLEVDVGWNYNPALYLKGKNYSYAAIGDTEWSEGTSNSDGSITFNGAFEGFIKYKFTDLTGDVSYNSSRNIEGIRVRLMNIGGNYGGAIVGPFFFVTADSASTSIVVPDAYKTAPIEATPVTSVTMYDGASGIASSEITSPFGWVAASGVKLTATTGYAAEETAIADTWKSSYVTLPADTTFGSETALIFYLKTEAGNAFIPMIGTKWGYIATPKMGATYYYAEKGATSWSEGTVVKTGAEKTGSNYHGTLVFDSAFEGYVKIDLKNIGHNDIGGISSGYAFSYIKMGFKGIGGEYGNSIVTGPYFLVNKDSNSTEIVVDDAYKPAPIQATPVTNVTLQSSASGAANATLANPLGWVEASGVEITATTGYAAEDTAVADTWKNSYVSLPAETTFGSETALIFYVKTEDANALIPMIGTKWGYIATPKMGATYYYADKDATSWSEGTVVKTGGEKAGSNYHGTLVFDSAFEGYVKIDLKNIGHNDIGGISSGYAFSYIKMGFKGIGGEYGDTIVTGPYFLVNKDSNSTDITVPEQYRPAAINVTAISDWYHNNYADFEAAGLAGGTWSTYTEAPLEFTSAIGDSIRIYNNTVCEFDPVSSSKIRTYITLNKGVDLTVAESLIVYVNVPAANTLLFNFRTDTDGSYVRSMTLKSGGTYYVAAKGDTKWTPKTAVYSGDPAAANQTYTGGIVFDGAFEGYIKLPAASIGCADEPLTAVKRGLASLVNIECKFKGLSDKYGNNAVVGPYFMATTDSTSTELKLNKLEGDINLDSFADSKDLLALRKYILGTDNAYVKAGGNLNKDASGEIDICDLVYMGAVADDIIFSNKSYYKTSNSGISGEIRTISAYVYMPDNIKASARGGVILGNYGLASNCLNFEIHQSGKPRLYSVNGSGQGIDIIFNGDIRSNEYAHLVITVDDANKTATCYINGELVEERTFTNDFDLTVSDLQFTLGGDYRTNNSNYLKGKLGEVALFGSTLTAADVTAIYNASTAADTDSLVALWNVGNTKEAYMAEDESGNANHLNPYTTFFYNEAEDIDRAYSFAVVGDTQSLASSYSGKFGTIYDWILENQAEKNIQHVFGLGDIVDNDTSENQWNTAVDGINKMNGKISYSLVRGNHDSNANMNKYFANESYMGQIDGFYKEGDVNNVYQKREIGNTKYLFMTLEYLADNAEAGSNPGQPLTPEEQDDIIAWAKGVIDANPDHKVILSTHYYINADGSITGVNDIETEIVAKCPNVFLVLGGHISSDNIVQGTTTNYEANGKSYKVTTLLVDPQGTDLSYNGLGLVAMLYFNEDGSKIEVEYYSTIRNQYFLRDNQFVISVE